LSTLLQREDSAGEYLYPEEKELNPLEHEFLNEKEYFVIRK
jgi:hypothetical protein